MLRARLDEAGRGEAPVERERLADREPLGRLDFPVTPERNRLKKVSPASAMRLGLPNAAVRDLPRPSRNITSFISSARESGVIPNNPQPFRQPAACLNPQLQSPVRSAPPRPVQPVFASSKSIAST